MPRLSPNKVRTQRKPKFAVGKDFKPGRYRFRLQVRDDAGNVSAPSEIVVTVKRKARQQFEFDPRLVIEGQRANNRLRGQILTGLQRRKPRQ